MFFSKRILRLLHGFQQLQGDLPLLPLAAGTDGGTAEDGAAELLGGGFPQPREISKKVMVESPCRMDSDGFITLFDGSITLFDGYITLFDGYITLFDGSITLFDG